MKVGTDGILLGAWASYQSPANILDIGTGCGLIALMLAQRFRASEITGIDIHSDSIQEAQKNAENSPFSSRLSFQETRLQDFAGASHFDLIVSNPPFFTNGIYAPNESRGIARHSDKTLSYPELAEHSARLLDKKGKLSLILPYKEGLDFMDIAKEKNLYWREKTIVYGKEGKKPERLLLSFSPEKGESSEKEMAIRDIEGNYTKEFKNLCRDFYLFL